MFRSIHIGGILILLQIIGLNAIFAQSTGTEVEVYDFADGLSHRNVFKIVQDSNGVIWLATINGLNSFDGYTFRHYHPSSDSGRLPVAMTSDMVLDQAGHLKIAGPDYITTFLPEARRAIARQIKPGTITRRESLAPHNLCWWNGVLYLTIYDEKNGDNWLAKYEQDSLHLLQRLRGNNTDRVLQVWQNELLLVDSTRIRRLNPQGELLETYNAFVDYNSEIGALYTRFNKLWVLLDNGSIYQLNSFDQSPTLWQKAPYKKADDHLNVFHIEEDGDAWVGGRGNLWYYDHWQRRWIDYDELVRLEIRNSVTYRQVFLDQTGVAWLSTNFGALKITQSDRLFDHYLSGGSEYCSNIYCSTRGMAEDEDGNIYISYYNSIHQLHPRSQTVRPLFPRHNYFNYPFGLAYHQGALYTGNGLKIDVQSLRWDTLLINSREDKGAVSVSRNQEEVWLGYEQNLYRHLPQTGEVIQVMPTDSNAINGSICYLYQPIGATDRWWIATLDNGLYEWQAGKGIINHLHAGTDSPLVLPDPQVNALVERVPGEYWLATGKGLTRYRTSDQSLRTYTKADGLPNDFINGILVEGDSALWVSTDNGLSRFAPATETLLNFSDANGLSANEFNRTSFLKASNGRMYFGGLNGVNAFLPGERYRLEKEERESVPLLLTSFSYLDGAGDSLRTFIQEERNIKLAYELTHRDRMFTAEFALMDYRNPTENTFQYYLEGYDNDWSQPSDEPRVRFSDLSPGKYVLHVRGRAGNENWTTQELSIPITIQPALYQRPWFWPMAVLLGIALVGGLMQLRVYALQKRREELEEQVQHRTRELEAEKLKSEELLLNILPAELAEELKKNGVAKAKRHEQVTVMFSDFQGFTSISKQLEPEELVAEIDLCFRAFDEITERHGLEKIKTIGDAYLLVGGIGRGPENQALSVVKAALEIQEFMQAIAVERRLHDRHCFKARIGIHTGPLVAGIVGIKKFAYDIWGDTVNIASRMESNGKVGKVNLSETTYQLVKDHLQFAPHGTYRERDNDQGLNMYLVTDYAQLHTAGNP